MIVDGVVGAFDQAGLLQALEEALAAVVQGGVLAVLADADDGHVAVGLGGGVAVGAVGGGGVAAAGGQAQDHGQGEGSAEQFFQVFHVKSLLHNIW